VTQRSVNTYMQPFLTNNLALCPFQWGWTFDIRRAARDAHRLRDIVGYRIYVLNTLSKFTWCWLYT
jgi:hypothetical protein